MRAGSGSPTSVSVRMSIRLVRSVNRLKHHAQTKLGQHFLHIFVQDQLVVLVGCDAVPVEGELLQAEKRKKKEDGQTNVFIVRTS